MSHDFRRWMRLSEAYFRGTRSDPTHSKRPTMSFTTDPDVASVYASIPKQGEYGPGARVSKADFVLKNPVDFSGMEQVDLHTALAAVGMADPSEHVDDVVRLVTALGNMAENDIPFDYKIYNNLDWFNLAQSIRRAASSENWDRFFDMLDYTIVDTYAVCDTKTFIRLAKQAGHDGIIHQDVFAGGAKVAPKLIGKTIKDTHLTYRPFGPVKWGV